MQGYFLIKVFGQKNELERLIEKIEEYSNYDDVYEELNFWQNIKPMKSANSEEETYIELGTVDGSTNVNELRLAYEFKETLEMLAEDFPEYKMIAEGRYLDSSETTEKYIKEKNDFEIKEVNDKRDK